MLTTRQIARHLKRITYKPGWKIRVYEGAWEGQHLVITTRVPDAYSPCDTVTLDVHTPLPPQRTLDDFELWLQWRLVRIESHEAREFLRRDGKPIFDPHGQDADRDLWPA